MLDVDNAIRFVLEQGLIDAGWVIDGDLTIRSVARRNRNLWIQGPKGAGYVIKQPDALSRASRRTLANEAAFYAFCQEQPGAAPVARLLPRLVCRDVGRSILALELVPQAVPLDVHQAARTARDFPIEASRGLGAALGTIHRVFRLPGLADDPRLAWMRRTVPWALTAHRPPLEMLASISRAGARMFRILQEQEGLEAPLDGLLASWRAETVIHGDIRSGNVLIRSTGSENGTNATEVRIIDWEFVAIGDPAWDLAGALHESLIFWTGSMPLESGLTVPEMVAQARYPLDVLRGAVRALWDGYRMASTLTAIEADELFSRAVLFSAARLIQASHERCAEQEELPAQAVILLQLSANLLADPLLGQVHLYGVAPECPP
jgi:hypothetical protein